MQEVITNAVTGEVTIRNFTPEEIAAMTPDPAVVLAQWRATASCSRMQLILALGETDFGRLQAARGPRTWAEKVRIDGAWAWKRNSQGVALLGSILGMDDAAIDALFVTAMGVND